jgi:hypothetical protein
LGLPCRFWRGAGAAASPIVLQGSFLGSFLPGWNPALFNFAPVSAMVRPA